VTSVLKMDNSRPRSMSSEGTVSTSSTASSREASPQMNEEEENDWQERVARPLKQGFYNFFFPKQTHTPVVSSVGVQLSEDDEILQDRLFVERFWKTYDDLVIISLFTQVGIVLRLCAATWFAHVGNTFRVDDALFVSLPLNCLSCWILGLISSGEDLMDIIHTRFTPLERQKIELHVIDEMEPILDTDSILRRRSQRHKEQKLGEDELREVQLLYLERRIRGSQSLALFPGVKQSNDVMEHYSQHGSSQDQGSLGDLELQVEKEGDRQVDEPLYQEYEMEDVPISRDTLGGEGTMENGSSILKTVTELEANILSKRNQSESISESVTNIQQQILQNVGRDISTNISRMRRVTLADGWDVGTDAQAMSDDLMLGLRDGFCGALSSFSSWNSSMVNLLQNGEIGEAIVGYTIGLQLPIVAYRFGQHMAVYLFVWRTRRETRTDERRGYGLRLQQQENSLDVEDDELPPDSKDQSSEATDQETPSVRAIVTALFTLAIVAQITSLFFFKDPQQHQIALSLLFSPFGALTRWRLSRYNVGRKGFPLGTFTCNLLACALSGSLGTILAGSPGPRERIVLVSMISGFAGSLSSLAVFIVETLRGIDPLLFRFDGFFYAISTVFWAMVIGLISNSSVDWAERSN